MHILSIVSFVIWCDIGNSRSKKFIFRCEFIFSVFRRLFFFRFLRFLSKPSKILLSLLVVIFLLLFLILNDLYCLSIDQLSLCIQLNVFLTILLRFLLFFFSLLLGRHGIKYSVRLHRLLTVNKRSNIYDFSFVLI